MRFNQGVTVPLQNPGTGMGSGHCHGVASLAGSSEHGQLRPLLDKPKERKSGVPTVGQSAVDSCCCALGIPGIGDKDSCLGTQETCLGSIARGWGRRLEGISGLCSCDVLPREECASLARGADG